MEDKPEVGGATGVVADSAVEAELAGGLRAVIAGISYKEIVDIFGLPNSSQPDRYKVDAEWLLRTPSGPATLYNWKPDLPGAPVADTTSWHIGGEIDQVVTDVMRALGPRTRICYRVPACKSPTEANRRMMRAAMNFADQIGTKFDKRGGILQCETCKATRPVGSVGHHLAHGWPTCCGQTVIWWTQRQVDAGQVPGSDNPQ